MHISLDNSYRYDDDGYLMEKVTPDGTTTYEYGTMGQLLAVSTPEHNVTYEHNALNQRVAKIVDGVVVEKYLWANLTTLLAVYDDSDNLVQRFEYADQRMPVSMTMGATKYYLHYDQVGSLRAVSDTNGTIIKEVLYDTFGNVLADSDPSFKVPFGFAGGLYDSDTKLTRFGYRDYDAFTGKWTAKDPIGFAGGDSNLYGYVLQDPVNLVDPEGLKNLLEKAWEYFFGESAEDMRKKTFCLTCKSLMKKGVSDGEACSLASKPVAFCGSDAGCRIDFGNWTAAGCQKTCK